jgi:heat-inducible transcriptional repressor
MPLSSREIDVLITIVQDYIATATPVGSRTVAKKSDLQLSPASMRNTMADLTDKGYLLQPHTSAGRIPTVEAFRFYLDTTLRLHPLTETRRQDIRQSMADSGLDMSNMLSQAAKVLSNMSHQASLITAPSRDDVRWREIEFALIKPGLVLAVLILEGGMVQNKLVKVEKSLSGDDLLQFANYLNAHYRGRNLSEARRSIHRALLEEKRRLKRMYADALTLAREAFEHTETREVYVDGAVNMLDYVEFADIARMREILRLLEERSRLLEVLDRTIVGEGIKITLAQEANLEEFNDLSVVSSPYGGEGEAQGIISVIGPQRMDYATVVPVVDYLAKTLTHLLKARY